MRPLLATSLLLASIGAHAAAITGTVIGSDGRAAAGARVAAFAPETSDEQRARWMSADPVRKPIVTTITSARGEFTIDPRLPVAEIRVDVDGYPAVGVRADDDAGVIRIPPQPLVRATVTADGKPLPDATVIVRSCGTETIAITDAHGQYRLPDPTRIASRILVLHAGYAPLERELDTIASRSGNVAMTAGVPLSGSVVADDRPVANALVQVDDLTLATTAADGAFAIAHAPPAGRRIVARAGERIASQLIVSRRRVVLRLGNAAAIAGSVRDLATGVPIAGALVAAGAPRWDAPDSGGWTISDAKGNYAIRGLAGGTYALTASHPAYTTPRLIVDAPAGGATRKALYASMLARIAGSVVDERAHAIGDATITIRGGSVPTPASLRAPERAVSAPDGRFVIRTAEEGTTRLDAKKEGFPAGHSGAIRIAPRTNGVTIVIPFGVALTGRVTTRERAPIAGASVSVADETVRTKSDGTFAIRAAEGMHDVAVSAHGFAPRTVRAEASPIEVVLDAAVEISGRVTRGGVPVDGVDIFVLGGDERPPLQSGAGGRFRIGDLAAGDVRLAFKKAADLISTTRTIRAPANDVEIEIPAGGRIAGHVIDAATHDPVTSFDAGVARGGAALMTTPAMRSFASDDGAFALEGVPAGAHTLAVSAPGYVVARVPNVSVESGRSIDDLEVALDRGVRVSGHVTGPDGGAAAGVLVRVDPAASTRGAVINDPFGVTDPDGAYAIEALDAGPTTLAFSRDGLPTVRKSVTLAAPSTPVDAQLGGGATIGGVVVLDGGAPVAGAEVRARSATEPGDRATTTDDVGTFVINAVAPGHYEITAVKSGFTSAALHDVEIPAAGALRLRMSGGGVIEGHVKGLSGAELQSASVQAWSTEGAFATASADDSGAYRIDGAPVGTVRVSARVAPPAGTMRNAATRSVQLDAGSSVTVDFDFASGNTISGRVTRNGTPLPGVTVAFAPLGPALPSARTDADRDGRYRVSGIDDGTYAVTVVDADRGSSSSRLDVSGSMTYDIDVKGARVTGRVSDDATGAAIGDALVELRRGSDLRSTVSDASGAFAFDDVAAGTSEAHVRKAGYGAATIAVNVADAGAPPLDVKLAPSPGVTLHLADARDHAPLTGWLHAESASGESFDATVAGDSARVALAAGTYRVTAGAAGYAPQTVTVVAPGEQTIALTPGATIVVSSSSDRFAFLRIADTAGVPVRFGPGAAGGLFRIDPSPGQTRIPNVAPGSYILQLLVDGNVLRTAPVTVREGETVPAKL